MKTYWLWGITLLALATTSLASAYMLAAMPIGSSTSEVVDSSAAAPIDLSASPLSPSTLGVYALVTIVLLILAKQDDSYTFSNSL
jgi:hypothetical protein